MCLYSKLIPNKKYLPTKKNNYCPPPLLDERLKSVAVGCGNCIECRKQKARQWQVRLTEEAKIWEHKVFCTFSFSPESLKELTTKYKKQNVNDVATKAIRLFLERYRKKNKVSIHHFFITELGEENTERIHLHGILFSNKEIDLLYIGNTWKYGNVKILEYYGQRTINYIVKYITKADILHKGYIPKILSSAGIGRNYIQTPNANNNKYIPNNTKETYTLPNGNKINLPIYYRNKIYTEEEREKLWLEKIEKHEIYVLGQKIDISTEEGINNYIEILKNSQKYNTSIGYGDNTDKWNEKKYLVTLAMLQKGGGQIPPPRNAL